MTRRRGVRQSAACGLHSTYRVARRVAVFVVALMLTPLATADAQTTPAAPAAPGALTANPHPTLPWFGQATPYGQFMRWLWQPPRAVAIGDRFVEEPGFWIAETTSGYYYPAHWVLAQELSGELTWRTVAPLFHPR